MGSFNQLQLFKNTINHRPSGQFLYHAAFTPGLDVSVRKRLGLGEDVDLSEYFGMYNPVYVEMKAPEKITESDFSKYFSDINIPSGAFINHLGVLEIPGSMYHFTQYISPLRNADDLREIEEFPYPDLTMYSSEGMKEQVEEAHKAGRVAVCGLTHMYEDAWQVRGYEQFLMDMLQNPERCEFILDRFKARNMIRAGAAAKAGVDIIICGDDVANQRALMFAPERWRSLIKARWAEVYKHAKDIKPDIQIWYHSDGNIMEIIPELIEIGVNILNPVQPECMDPIEIKKLYGDRIVLDGTIGTQTVMPFGTPDEVRRYVRERIDTLGYDGALIIAPTHVLEPEVPVDNILAFFEAAGRL